MYSRVPLKFLLSSRLSPASLAAVLDGATRQASTMPGEAAVAAWALSGLWMNSRRAIGGGEAGGGAAAAAAACRRRLREHGPRRG